jgi:hypothetical protein
MSFARVGDTVYAAALVSLSRTAMSERPMPVRRMWATIAITTSNAMKIT